MATHDIQTELFYSGEWHTHAAYDRDPVVITRGSSDEAGGPNPGTATFTLPGWRFNPNNPNSDLYGLIGRNTPVTITVDGELRFAGEVAAWTPRHSLGGDRWVEVQAAGVTRRLGQGADPLRSAPEGFALVNGAIGYWSLSDGPRAPGSSIPGDPPMTVWRGLFGGIDPSFGGEVALGPGELAPWLAPGLKVDIREGLQSRGLRARLQRGTTGVLSFGFLYKSEDPTTDDASVAATLHDSLGQGWDLLVAPDLGSTGFRLSLLHDDGTATTLLSGSSVTARDGGVHWIQVTVAQVGGNVAGDIGIDGEVIATGSFSSRTLGAPKTATTDWFTTSGLSGSFVIGGLVFWDKIINQAAATRAAFGFAGETAGRRIQRLCIAQGVPFVGAFIHDLDDTLPMGPQHPDGPLALVEECVITDQGVIDDAQTTLNDAPALDYRPGREGYNQGAALVLDYAAAQIAPPFEPAVDDQQTRNDVTATRRDGGSARKELTSGPLSVQAPPDGAGRYTTQVDVNPLSDTDLADHAGWHLHLGVDRQTRYPRITVDLDAKPDLAASVADVKVGDRIDILNLPPDLTPDVALLRALGWTETVELTRRRIAFICAPEVPYHISEIEHADYGIVGSDSAVTAETLDTTETGVDINCAAGPDWIHENDFDIVVGGERMTVTAVGAMAGTFPNRTTTLTVSRSVNAVVKSHATGAPVAFFHKSYIGL